MKIVAHMGESEAAPANTLEAFALAWLRGAECIEGDFHLLKDGTIACMHDGTAQRTCGVDRKLADLTLAELKKLDCGSWKSPAWRYTRVPTLPEVLRTVPSNGEIFIELKCGPAILDFLGEVFAASGLRPEQLTVIAFDEAVISGFKKRFPAHAAYWLTCNGLENSGGNPSFAYTPDELVEKLKTLGADGVDVLEDPARRPVSAAHIEALHNAGLVYNVWTVDDPAAVEALIRCGVDSITTNRAFALKEELAARRVL